MRQKIANFIVTVLEIGGIAGLVGVAINAEWKRHKAENAKLDAELAAAIWKFNDYVKGLRIKDLEKELEELRAKEEA